MSRGHELPSAPPRRYVSPRVRAGQFPQIAASPLGCATFASARYRTTTATDAP